MMGKMCDGELEMETVLFTDRFGIEQWDDVELFFFGCLCAATALFKHFEATNDA
jgi:hypothetical protein